MKVLGLTGGIGMGKTTAATSLAGLGWDIIDTDDLAREVVAPGLPAWHEVRAAFGAESINADGTLNRQYLAQLVFGSPPSRHKLEQIVHPRIRERWVCQVEEARQRGSPGVVVVIPLLYETKAEAAFEKIICTGCKPATQLSRLRARRWSDQQIQQRLAAQWPADQKMLRADFVIWTEGSLELQREQLRRVTLSVAGNNRMQPPAT